MIELTCARCRTQLLDYEHGELDAPSDAAVFAHLHSCDVCRAAWHEDLALAESLRASFEEKELPMAVVAKVRQAMRGAPAPTFAGRLRELLRPAIVAPTAAALIVAAIGIAKLDSLRSGPTLSSTYFVRQHIAQTMSSPSTDRAWATYFLASANAERVSASSAP